MTISLAPEVTDALAVGGPVVALESTIISHGLPRPDNLVVAAVGDASSAAPLRAIGPSRFLRWIQGCATLFANDDELAALGAAAPVLTQAAELVAKHGAAGASWTDGTRSASVPALEARVLDTVGAGDAFDAGYLDAILDGHPPADALHAGVVLAAKAIAQVGARP